MPNKKLFSLIVVGFFALIPASVSAQQNLQNGGSLQQNQTSNNTQNTGTIQTPTAPSQGGNSNLLENNNGSLGVVGNPSQSNPSVVVTDSNTKTEVNANQSDNSSSVWKPILIIVGICLFAFIGYRIFATKNNKPVVEPEKEIKPEVIEPKIQSKKATASKQKPATKTTTATKPKSKKKKKKRSHR